PDASGRDLLAPELLPHLQEAERVYGQLRSAHPLSFIAFSQVPFHHFGRLRLEQSQVTVRTPFLDNDFVSLSYRKPASLVPGKEFSLRMIDESRPDLSFLATDRLATQASGACASAFRRFTQKLTFKLEYAYDYGMPERFAPIDRI